MLGSQLTAAADGDFATAAWRIFLDLFKELESKNAELAKFNMHVFLLVDGEHSGFRYAPEKMTVSRRKEWIYVKMGIKFGAWEPLDEEGRVDLAATTLFSMLEAGCARAVKTLQIDSRAIAEFLTEFKTEFWTRISAARSC